MENNEIEPASVPEASVAPHPFAKIFFGPYGLRAGWSIALFLAVFLLLSETVELLVIFMSHAHRNLPTAKGVIHETPPVSVVFSHLIPLIAALVAAFILSRVERRSTRVYGLGGHGRASDCIKGLITGVAGLSVLVGLLRWSHLLVFAGFNVTGSTALRFGFEWLAGFFVVGVAEEYLFRGYLQYTLTRGLFGLFSETNPRRRFLAFWAAVLVLSVLFLLVHIRNPGETPLGLTAVFFAGLLFAYSLWRTGSLWWAIGFHATWDWSQSFLYGVGDSGTVSKGRLLLSHPQGNPLLNGGQTGPEGSIFVFPVLLLIALIIRFTLPKREQPPVEPGLPEDVNISAATP